MSTPPDLAQQIKELFLEVLGLYVHAESICLSETCQDVRSYKYALKDLERESEDYERALDALLNQ